MACDQFDPKRYWFLCFKEFIDVKLVKVLKRKTKPKNPQGFKGKAFFTGLIGNLSSRVKSFIKILKNFLKNCISKIKTWLFFSVKYIMNILLVCI